MDEQRTPLRKQTPPWMDKDILDRLIGALELAHQLTGKIITMEERLKQHTDILEGGDGRPGLKTEIALMKQQAIEVLRTLEVIGERLKTDEHRVEENRRDVSRSRVERSTKILLAIIGGVFLLITTLLTIWAQFYKP